MQTPQPAHVDTVAKLILPQEVNIQNEEARVWRNALSKVQTRDIVMPPGDYDDM